ATGAPVLETGEAPLVKITARPEAVGQLKAFVTVLEGCEKGCTFCVVPVTRGRERSHSPASIVAEVRELAAAGVREVTLLGQTVNAYGRDLTPATDLAALLELVDEVEGIERIRFTTSNPYNLTPRPGGGHARGRRPEPCPRGPGSAHSRGRRLAKESRRGHGAHALQPSRELRRPRPPAPRRGRAGADHPGAAPQPARRARRRGCR